MKRGQTELIQIWWVVRYPCHDCLCHGR